MFFKAADEATQPWKWFPNRLSGKRIVFLQLFYGEFNLSNSINSKNLAYLILFQRSKVNA